MLKKRHMLWSAAALLIAATTLDAEAGLFRGARQPQPPMAVETLPSPGSPVMVAGAALPAGCCRPVCVQYRDHAKRSVCCDPCMPDIKTTLVVCDPCTGCPVAIDVCLPGCCTDCPTVSERCTLIGRGAITYCWSCGFSATFRFRKHGDVVVIYRS